MIDEGGKKEPDLRHSKAHVVWLGHAAVKDIVHPLQEGLVLQVHGAVKVLNPSSANDVPRLKAANHGGNV